MNTTTDEPTTEQCEHFVLMAVGALSSGLYTPRQNMDWESLAVGMARNLRLMADRDTDDGWRWLPMRSDIQDLVDHARTELWNQTDDTFRPQSLEVTG